MGIFDIFTNKSAEEAARKNAELYAQYGREATGALRGYGTAASDIYGRLGAAGEDIYGALGTTADQYLTGSTADARTALGAGREAYAPVTALGQKYGGATSLYLDALGVNGPGGADRAKAAFTTGPGYQFAVDQATDAAARKAASLGIAGSGNTLDAIRDRAQGFANQEYGTYLSRLGGFVSPELEATRAGAAGTAAGYGAEADLLSRLGAARAGLAGDVARGRIGLAGTVAGGQAGVARDVAQGQIGIGGNVTGGIAQSTQSEADAANRGSANFWNLLANLGGAAVRGYTGGAGYARA